MDNRFKKPKKPMDMYEFEFPTELQQKGLPDSFKTMAYSPKQALTRLFFGKENVLDESRKFMLETDIYPALHAGEILYTFNGIAVEPIEKIEKRDAEELLRKVNLRLQKTESGAYKMEFPETKESIPDGYVPGFGDVIGKRERKSPYKSLKGQFNLPFPPMQLELFENSVYSQ